MTTSANVIEYSIYRKDDPDFEHQTEVGHFRKNIMCKYPDYAELLKYQSLKDYIIVAWGYDEDDEYWENDEEDDKDETLEDFLKGMKSNKHLKDYFAGVKTSEQILQEVKDAQDKMYKGITDNLNKKLDDRRKKLRT